MLFARCLATQKWLKKITEKIPEKKGEARAKVDRSNSKRWHTEHVVKKGLADPYNKVAWLIHKHVTSTIWFEAFIMVS